MRFKNLKRIEGLIVDAFDDIKKSDRNLVEVAEFTKTRIQQQTRLGRSLPNEGRKLKPLSKSYKDQRRNSRIDKDSEFFDADRSNLTHTGQLLRSLTSKIIRDKGLVEVFPKGKRNDGKTNQQVACFVKDGGRPFLGLDDRATEQIKKIVLTNIRRLLRQRF